METCDSLTIWSSNSYQSYTFIGKIITPNPVPLSIGNEVKEDVVIYYPKFASNETMRYRIASISHISLALIIETNVQELKKNGVEITNSTKMSTVIQIQIDDDKNENNFKLLENIIGINRHEESATAQIFDNSVPPSSLLEQEPYDCGNLNSFDIDNI